MSVHVVSTKHLVGFTLVSAIISALLVFIGIAIKYAGDLPTVRYNPETGRCIDVINYANGDAYVCSDVGIILRRYNLTVHPNTNSPTDEQDVPEPIENTIPSPAPT